MTALKGFFYEEMYGRFAGLKKTGHDKQVTIIIIKVVVRQGSTVCSRIS